MLFRSKDPDIGERAACRGVDLDDPRPRVGRAHQCEVEQPGQDDVVDEPTAPGEEALIFLASGGLTNHRSFYAMACFTRSAVNGSARSRLPVAFAIPLAMAAAVGPCEPSPTPRNRSAG